jgi:hypothetical protein
MLRVLVVLVAGQQEKQVCLEQHLQVADQVVMEMEMQQVTAAQES